MAYLATIGFFDGVHRGHRSLIRQLQSHAKTLHLQPMLVTFSYHPLAIIQGHSPQLLLSHDERIARLRQLGIRHLLELDFESVHAFTAREFMHYLHEHYQVDALLMGYDHHFGSDRMADLSDYQQSGRWEGVEVFQAKQASRGAISSTRIRHALREGRITDANRMLGYPYTLTGTVVHGQHIGTSLGFPTANLNLQSPLTPHPSPILLPKTGVYAARVNALPALVNIGHNPTFGPDQPLSIEVHIPGFHGDLYGQTLSVQLLHYLREDQSFPSQEALITQIHQDIDHLAQLL